ncbi:putative s-adenosylmethionine-dependent methyltransferase, partial [Quercus suber]
MEDKRTHELPELYAPNGGEGPYSYSQNSNYQRGVVEAAKEKINEAIANHFDIQTVFGSKNPVCIVDLGCSTGANTFITVQTIVEAIKLKYKSKGVNAQIPDFLVFFNDNVSNDFNTLFKSLPPNRQYFAAGVPGSFHGCLFPKGSLHLIHSSCALNWLSKIPIEITDESSPAWNKGRIHYTNATKEVVEAYETQFASCLFPKGSLHLIHSSCALNWLSKIPIEITDESSPAWNKGRIHYTNATKEVVEAYETQFAKDMESFLFSRAQELVVGGLLVLFVPAVPDVMSNSDTFTGTELDTLGSCLMDMAKAGLVEEAKVDSFNVPAYYTPPKKLKALIERNGNFSIKRMEVLNNQKKHLILQSASLRSLYLRAVLEGIIEKHFGNEILDELFNRFTHKVEGSSFFLNPETDKLIILDKTTGTVFSSSIKMYGDPILYEFKVKLNPSLADAWLCLANCIGKKGLRSIFSKELLHSCIKQGTENEAELVKESIQHAKEAITLDVKDGNSWYNLRNACLTSFFVTGAWDHSKLQQSSKAYQNAEKDDRMKSNPDLYFNCATVNKYRENYEKALSGFEAAALKDPGLNATGEVQKMFNLLDKLENMLRGHARSKRLASLSSSLAAVNLNSSYKRATIDLLLDGLNKAVAVVGKVLFFIKHDNVAPLYCLLCDSNQICFILSVYGFHSDTIKEGDQLTLLEPYYRHFDFSWKEKISWNKFLLMGKLFLLTKLSVHQSMHSISHEKLNH